MNCPTVSIIVPVYNVEKYIHKCIDSVLAQTFTDFELLLINDGSSDSSAQICDGYAEKDERVKVFHKENGGVSSARNVGLQHATGEWISFIDSDDWLDETYLDEILGETVDNDFDFLVHGLTREFPNNTIIVKPHKRLYKGEELYRPVEEFLWNYGNLFGFPWNKLYKNKIIQENKLCFNESLSMCEDELFNFQYCNFVKFIQVSNYSGYHYRQLDEGNLTSKKIESGQIEVLLKASLLLVKDYLTKSKVIVSHIVRKYFYFLLMYMKNADMGLLCGCKFVCLYGSKLRIMLKYEKIKSSVRNRMFQSFWGNYFILPPLFCALKLRKVIRKL